MHKIFSALRFQKLKTLLIVVIGLSLLCAVFDSLFYTSFGLTLTDLFSLSLWGGSHYLLFQPFTAAFLMPSPDGLSFSFLLNLFFYGYIFYIVSSQLIDLRGEKSFFSYLISLVSTLALSGYLLLFLFFIPKSALYFYPYPLCADLKLFSLFPRQRDHPLFCPSD